MRTTRFLAAAVLGGAVLPAFAGPADDARHHLQAIADANLAAIAADYAPNAVFQWVGGPLDGAYADPAAIRGVWTKFTKANGRIGHSVNELRVSANPKGATVTADVVFKASKDIKVRYVMTYRDGKLVNEIWQIDPKLKAAAY
jgi:ketosteroid isomerase-like protein